MLRYDARLADAPYSIHLVDPSVLDYTSDGSTGLEFLLWVTDVAGQNVTAGQTLCHCPMDDHGMFSKRQDLPRHEIESAFTVFVTHCVYRYCHYVNCCCCCCHLQCCQW